MNQGLQVRRRPEAVTEVSDLLTERSSFLQGRPGQGDVCGTWSGSRVLRGSTGTRPLVNT